MLALPAPAPEDIVAARARAGLAKLIVAWRRDGDRSRGDRFANSLQNFFLAARNPNTRRAYSFSILQFWDWLLATTSLLPTPDRIERKTVLVYSAWLRTNQLGMEESRLQRDPARTLDASVYAVLKRRPGMRIAEIRERLLTESVHVKGAATGRVLLVEASDPDGLDKRLACLVEQRLLRRTPSLEELRRQNPGMMRHLETRPDPNLFSYEVASRTAAGPDRAGTVALRLAALSSFWGYAIATEGENTGTTEPLLRHNIWQEELASVVRESAAHQAVTRAKKTPQLALYEKIVGTMRRDTFRDVRDRAILEFLRWTGVRAEELGSLKRLDISGADGPKPLVTVHGKGDIVRIFGVPPDAIRAIHALTAKLERLAEDARRRSPNGAIRMDQLMRPEAPLFPALVHWGCNASISKEKDAEGLSRSAISMMLRRRAVEAGISPGSEEFARVHPHGFRAMAALAATEAGVPINVVQRVLGHSSLGTTTRYVEQHDPSLLSLYGGSMTEPTPVAVAPAAPRREVEEVPRRRAPVIIDTTAHVEFVPTAPRGQDTMPVAARSTARAPEAGRPMPATPRPAEAVPDPRRELPTIPDKEAPVRPAPPAEPPPAPAPHGLVGLGKQARPQVPTRAEGVVAMSDMATLDLSYTKERWGGRQERNGRAKLHEKKEDVGPDIDARDDALTHAYASRHTGLLWWDGPTGKLVPRMPILAPQQITEDSSPYGSVVKDLEQLWGEWVTSEEVTVGDKKSTRGPTAARALLRWFEQSLSLMEQTERERLSRNAEWVGYGAPLDVTETEAGKPVERFRRHREDKIVLWFRARGYTYMDAPGRDGGATGARVGRAVDDTAGDYRPKDAGGVDMSWYDEPDPLAALSRDERIELRDWLRALTGESLMDTTKRFKRKADAASAELSRVDLGRLLGALCAYDAYEDDLGEVLRDRRTGKASESDVKDAKERRDLAGKAVEETVRRMTGDAKEAFAIKERVDARVKATRTAMQAAVGPSEAGKGRERRRDFYLKLIGDLFGEAAQNDELLRLFALCDKAPLRGRALPLGGDYSKLFKFDPVSLTIVHSAEFAREFGRATGAHSECVARRIARHLWELRRAGKSRLEHRPDELLAALDAWAYYKIPCPAALERELRDRLQGAPPNPLLDVASREREALLSGALTRTTMEQDFFLRRGVQEIAELRRGGDTVASPGEMLAEGGGFNYVRNMSNIGRHITAATKYIPSPITMAAWLHLRG